MKKSSRPLKSDPGFTLIELLTVIAIIAILMGLLFPAVAAVKEAARKAQAKNDCAQIVAAVKAYNTEYGKYPPIEISGGGKKGDEDEDMVIGDPACTKAKTVNNVLFNTLRAIDRAPNAKHSLNPRKIPFFEGKAASDASAPRAGFLEKGGEAANLGCYFDPWGKQYNIIIDSNYDNQIAVDQVYDDSDWKTEGRPRVGVGVFSMGKDNEIGEKKQGLENKYRDGQKVSDDVVSWQ
jgi:prepilin-type N-terminal cleavage/methylation domain-containing protein